MITRSALELGVDMSIGTVFDCVLFVGMMEKMWGYCRH
jgi:hypothetical protein